MRLIDTDALKDRASEQSLYKTEYEDFCEIVDAEPTAYDVDEIVQQIEQLRMQYFLTIANTGDKTLDVAYEKVGEALNGVLDIVKAGGKTE